MVLKLSETDIATLHAEQKAAIAWCGAPPAGMSGRGIVTGVYDAEFPSCWVLLNELVRLGVDLPVEAWHRPGEVSDQHLALLSGLPLNLRLRVIEDDLDGPTKRPFAIKPIAIQRSAFREVLWIDSDCFPIRDPSFLFDDPGYVEKGSLFWHDMMSIWQALRWRPNAPVWQVFNVPANDSQEFESGQLLIDKARCWPELCLTVHFNERRDVYYEYVFGDKDTFRLAWLHLAHARNEPIEPVRYLGSAHVPYGFTPYGPFSMGALRPDFTFGGGTVIVHRDREGSALFNHRCIQKFRLGENSFNRDVANEAVYHAAIEDLRRLTSA